MTSEETRIGRRSSGRTGGRAARVSARSAETQQFNPCPPGQLGGTYKPLTEPGLRAIYDTALRLLSELGIGDVPEGFRKLALSKGARLNQRGRLVYPPALIEDVIAGAARKFVFHGRDPKHDFEIGGDMVRFGTGGAAVQTLDIDTGVYRPSTLHDLYDFTRLIDTLTNVSWFTRSCVATDIPDNFDLDANTAYALLADRDDPRTWADKGAPDLRGKARDRARSVLADHYPDYISTKSDRAIRDRFNILLAPQRMRPPGSLADHHHQG